MTAWEKMKLEHPDKIHHILNGTCRICPDMYGYLEPLPADKCLGGSNCHECWNREIPENKEKNVMSTTPNVKVVTESENVPRILDSGARQEFGTGAVRDIQEGKGRCDLMPLDVVADIYHAFFPEEPEPGEIFGYIAAFQEGGNVGNLYYALDNFDQYKGYSDMLLEVAIHFEEGANKYGENNWQKGIPVKRYIDSAVRHYLKFLRGDKDEPHDRAFCWNIMCAIWTCKHKPELNDYHDVEKPIKAAKHVIKTCDDALKRMEEDKPPARFYAEDNE